MDRKNNILIVLTNTRDFPEQHRHPAPAMGMSAEEARRTGFDVLEVAYLYYCLCHEGSMSVTFASPRGGECYIDPSTMKKSESDEHVRKFIRDTTAMEKIKRTERLESIDPEKYECVVFPGGPGVLFDLPSAPKINELVTHVWERNNGYIATIGHGIAALLNVKSPKTHDAWLKGKKVTANTVEEEKDMQLDKALPFLLEQKLREIGARFEKTNKNESYVVLDERLITGQNRNSAREWVQKIAQQCSSHRD